ncbi:type IV pilus assembly protein PilF [Candidatus Magnetomoraceae bacterium gMMP-1]
MVKINIILYIVFNLLITACVTDTTQQRKQSEAIRKLGEVYMSQAKYNLALKELLKAESLYSDDPYLQNDLGLAYLSKKEINLAVIHFKQALKLKPDYPPATNNLGTAYLEQKQWNKAIVCFKQIIENVLYATPHFPLSNLGWAYYNKKDYETSVKFYQKALEISPKFAIAQRGLGRTYIKMNKLVDAIEYLEKAIKNAHGFAEAYFDLAGIYELRGNYKKAVQNYKKVMAMVPESSLYIKAKTRLKNLQPIDYAF